MEAFDLSGIVRRIRRRADLSQRELAEACGIAQSTVAQAESGRRDLQAGLLARAAALAGLRLALLDGNGCEVAGMSPDAVRDLGRRRFPAHLDTHHSDERPGRYEHRFDRPLPWFTVDRHRGHRDDLRARTGTPEDHHLPQPGDSPAERRARRRRAARDAAEDRRRRAGEAAGAGWEDTWTCTCPAACDVLDDGSGPPVHAPDCVCGCDLG
ncbi:helix-turn-helix domain-containing protein [Geodermatophilus sp. SYSU D00758]